MENLSAYFRYPATPQSHLHYECNRIGAPSVQEADERAFPGENGLLKLLLSGTDERSGKMDNADPGWGWLIVAVGDLF